MLSKHALVFMVVALATLSFSLGTQFCVECGHDGNGCDAAYHTKSYYKLDGQDKRGDMTFVDPMHAVSNTILTGNNYFAQLDNADAHYGFKFELSNLKPMRSDGSDPGRNTPDGLVLWLIADGTTQRYFYLRGIGTCRGLWRHQKADSLDRLAVFAYHLF